MPYPEHAGALPGAAATSVGGWHARCSGVVHYPEVAV